MTSMIYIYTGRLSEDPRSGSAVRPVRMLKAFKEIGFDVEEVTGYSAERRKSIAKIKDAIRRGARFDFCYMETTTMPVALGDPGHMPLRPFMDLRFINYLRSKNIPVLLFYRDIYWNFPSYGKSIGMLKRAGAKLFYRFELACFYRILSKLYLPSEKMARYVPGCPHRLVAELPPGCVPKPLEHEGNDGSLNLLYVGGVTPPNYDTSDMLACIQEADFIHLTIVCRRDELPTIEDKIRNLNNVKIEHRSSKELEPLYDESDAVMIFNRPTEYLSFSMPIKLFEAIGYGVPVIARSGTAVGEFVEREKVGWAFDRWEDARRLFESLMAERGLLKTVRGNAQAAVKRHTWEERARQVARDAEEIRVALAKAP